MAALVVVVALVGGRDTLVQGADARVDITLEGSAGVDAARSQLITDASGTWQATRIAESTEDDTATVEFALPGSSLDGFVAELRNHPMASDVEVTLEVDPDQLEPESLASPATAGGADAAEPVRVEVNLRTNPRSGAWLTIAGAVVVALMALVALVVVQRRFSGDDDFTDSTDGPEAAH